MSLASSDRTLVHAARRGDKRAFAALVERHYPVILAGCRHMLGATEPARDAAQEAVLRAMLGLDSLRDPERFGAWLAGIALNVCRSFIGARVREAESLDVWLEDRLGPEPSDPGIDPADRAHARDIAARVRRAIAPLPAGQREAVALFYLAGLTHAEIADEVGTRPGAIKTRLHKARRTLRASLHDLHEEQPAMSQQPVDLIPMHVADLRRTTPSDPDATRHIVYLEDDEGSQRLRIWIGAAEAASLAGVLENVELPRPGVYHFAASLVSAAGTELREVRITDLTDSVFYAEAVLADGTTVDARPSDALTLALVTGAPIYVRSAVLEQTARQGDALHRLVAEADTSPDDARVIANDVRARMAALAAELAAGRPVRRGQL